MRSQIMIVDELPMRSSFLRDLLQDLGSVVEFTDPHAALAAVGRGLPVDVAVVAHNRHAGELIRALGRRGSRVLAFGSQRTAPAGIDHYLFEPLLAYDVYKLVEEIGPRRKRKSNGLDR